MSEIFPTAFYEQNEIPVCPNGDKVRSDELGAFCLVEGERVSVRVAGSQVILQPVSASSPEQPVEPTSKRGKKSTEGSEDGNG